MRFFIVLKMIFDYVWHGGIDENLRELEKEKHEKRRVY